MRNIKLDSLEATAIDVMKETCGYTEVQAAIGYLSQWSSASEHYPRATLWFDPKEREITATYFKTDDTVGYVIGAVWHGDHFGFHS